MKKLHPFFISFLVMLFVVITISDATAVTITVDGDTKGADYNSIGLTQLN
jgi:hypothetical protein